VIFEDFVQNPQRVLNGICDFWGVRRITAQTFSGSQNKLLRYPWLYRARKWVSRHQQIKRMLADSQLFNAVYRRFLTQNSRGYLAERDRAQLRQLYEDDVAKLEALIGRSIFEWRDFHAAQAKSERPT